MAAAPAPARPVGARAGARAEAESRPAEERVAQGKRLRGEVPRSSHAGFEPAPGRPDPIELLERQAATRVPELVPIRYGRMLVSPFTFYRGAALVMAADLATTPRSGLRAQLCGDAHLSNFGIFGSPERHLVFDLNDFDETFPGPWEWDVKRLAASLAVAGRGNGFDRGARESIVLEAVRQYREAMREFASMTNLEVWYSAIDVERVLARNRAFLSAKAVRRVEEAIAKARTHDSLRAFNKLTTVVDGEPRFVSDPPVIVPIGELVEADRKAIQGALGGLVRDYRRTLAAERRHLLEQYRVVDMARKVVGVGSVGTRAWVLLLLGRDGRDPLMLQAKEARASVLDGYALSGRHTNQGERVVRGQKLMQAASDIFLGWQRTRGIDGQQRDFYLRQLHDWKGSATVEAMEASGMAVYGRLCAHALARAHARSGDRFDRALSSFAEAYADQNERDYDALVGAVRSGRIRAETGI